VIVKLPLADIVPFMTVRLVAAPMTELPDTVKFPLVDSRPLAIILVVVLEPSFVAPKDTNRTLAVSVFA
jgi:hypothetical protein